MAYFADDIATYLAANGCGTISGVNANIFVGRLPDTPANCLAIYERPGGPPLITMTGIGAASVAPAEDKTSNPRVQIRVRDTLYDVGRTKIYLAFSLLQGKTQTVLGTGTVTFKLIDAVQSPTHLGLDELQRHEWSVNFACMIEDGNR